MQLASQSQAVSSAARTTSRAPVRTWSLRTVLVVSLLVFCLLPAFAVGWVLYRSNLQTVDALSEKIVYDVAQRVQQDAEEHLGQAHIVFNGIVPMQPTATDVLRARQFLQKPELFEQTAFSMTRMTPNVSYMYFGTAQGEFMGLETQSQDATGIMRIGLRKVGDEGRRYFPHNLQVTVAKRWLQKLKTMSPVAGLAINLPWKTKAVSLRLYTHLHQKNNS